MARIDVRCWPRAASCGKRMQRDLRDPAWVSTRPNSAVERPAQERLIARPKQPLTARGRDITLASKLPIAFTESVGKSIDLGVLISGRQGGGADVGVALEIRQSAL